MNRHNQRSITGRPRTPGTGYFDRPTEQAIRSEQRRYGVSRSFVIREAVAFALHVPTEARDSYKRQTFRVIRGGKKRKVG